VLIREGSGYACCVERGDRRCETDNNSFWPITGRRGMTSEQKYWQFRYAWRMPFPIIAMRCSTLLPSFNNNDETGRLKNPLRALKTGGGALPRRFVFLRVRVGVSSALKMMRIKCLEGPKAYVRDSVSTYGESISSRFHRVYQSRLYVLFRGLNRQIPVRAQIIYTSQYSP
jgi:hypothetical protein